MKMLIQACLATALLCLASGSLASSTIELKDGSRIEGEIQSLENGMYTIRSSSIGTVHIAQSNIVRIVYNGDPPNAAGSLQSKSSAQSEGVSHDIQQMQMSLAQDPKSMQSIMSLQSDPQIQAILNDPAIIKAIQSGDYMSLLSNPKIQALESNEHVKQVVKAQER